MTKSEKLLKELCELSFLKMWSHSSPTRIDNNKELCDLLIYTPDWIIIFSVKEIKITSNATEEIKEKRWNKKAIEESVKQIYGAERALKSNIAVVGTNSKKIPIKITENTKIFRVAIAFGSEGKFDYQIGNFGLGFVHVFDELSTLLIFKELNTISDFIKYLEDKEIFYSKSRVIIEREIDQLGHYLINGKTFPENLNLVIFQNGIWEEYSNRKEYAGKREEDKKSYFWDNLIDHFIYHEFNGSLTSNQESIEEALRLLSYETRFNRRILSESFLDFISKNKDTKKHYTRTQLSPSNVAYVFFLYDINPKPEELRKVRRDVLEKKCIVTRALYPNSQNVIGIAFNPNTKIFNAVDLLYFYLPALSDDFLNYAEEIREIYGFHKNAISSEKNIKEFPD